MWHCAVNGSYINLLFTSTVRDMRERKGTGGMMGGGLNQVDRIFSLHTLINLLRTQLGVITCDKIDQF